MRRVSESARGEEVQISPAPAYRDYIAWLKGRDAAWDESLWRESLAGFTAPTPLIADTDTGAQGPGRHNVALDPEVAAVLWALTRSHRITLNTDNFFELGGHSLMAAQVVSPVPSLFDVEVAVRNVFEAPTIGALAVVVEGLILEEIESLSEPDLSRDLSEMSADGVGWGDLA